MGVPPNQPNYIYIYIDHFSIETHGFGDILRNLQMKSILGLCPDHLEDLAMRNRMTWEGKHSEVIGLKRWILETLCIGHYLMPSWPISDNFRSLFSLENLII